MIRDMDSFKKLHAPDEFINPHTGKPESFEERTERVAGENEKKHDAAWQNEKAKLSQAGFIKPTQQEQRKMNKQQRQAELERAKLTQQDILNKCNSDGGCKVTINDVKNAFPKMISQIDGNNYRTQIDNKQFHEFLLKNHLTFSLPDFVFKKQI
jgi:hypothetical protein